MHWPFASVQIGGGAVSPHDRAVVGILTGVRPARTAIIRVGVPANRSASVRPLFVVQDGADDGLVLVILDPEHGILCTIRLDAPEHLVFGMRVVRAGILPIRCG